MTLSSTPRFIKHAGQSSLAFLQSRVSPNASTPLWQWAVVVLVGLGLGLYLSLIPLFHVPGVIQQLFDFSNRTWTLLFILIALAPFAGIVAAGFTRNLQKLLLTIILLEIPIQIDYRIGYWEEEARYGATSGFTISVTMFCLIILYTWWLVNLLSKRCPPPSRFLRQASLPPLAYLGAVVLSVTVAYQVMPAVNEIVLIVQATLLYIYLINAIKSRQDLKFVLTLLLLGLIINSLVVIVMGVTGHGGFDKDPNRVSGLLKNPNLSGSYLGMAVVFSFSLLATSLERRYKLLAALAMGLGGIAVFFTGSRGSWVGFGVALSLFCLIAWSRGWLPLKIPLAYVGLALSVGAIFYQRLLERLFSNSAFEAATARWPLNLLALRMIRDHFLLGVGSNNFARNLHWYVTAQFSRDWISTVHNQYLLVWAETGILGLGTYLWFLLGAHWRAWRVWRYHQDRVLAPLALGFSAALLAGMIHMMVEKYHARIQIETVWITAAMIMSLYKLAYFQDADQ